MIFVNVLVASALITLSGSVSFTYSTYQNKGLTDENRDTDLIYLIDDRDTIENEISPLQIPKKKYMRPISNTAYSTRQKKTFHSLSITHPMDVLRERYLLEIARKQEQKHQQKADENRRLLTNIGKRSLQDIMMHNSQMKDDETFENEFIKSQNRMDGILNWYKTNNAMDMYKKK